MVECGRKVNYIYLEMLKCNAGGIQRNAVMRILHNNST